MTDDRPGYRFTPSQPAPPTPCPYCGTMTDAAAGITGADLPDPGDAGLCGYCAGLLVYDVARRPREPTEAELPDLLADRRLVTAQAVLREAIRRRPPR